TDGSKANMMFRPLRLAIATASAPCAFSNLMSKESMASMMRSMSTAGSALSTEVSDAEFCGLVMVVLAFSGHKVRVLLFDPFKGTQDGINGGHDERIKLVARYASANMWLTECGDREFLGAAVEKAQSRCKVVLVPLIGQHENLWALGGRKRATPQ